MGAVIWIKSIGGTLLIVFMLLLLPTVYSDQASLFMSPSLMHVCLAAWLAPLIVGWVIAAIRGSWSQVLLALGGFILYPFAMLYLYQMCLPADAWTRVALILTPALVVNGMQLACLAKPKGRNVA